jgi:hypothetical protein
MPWDIDHFDVLPGWYDDWVLIERERLRQRVFHAMEQLSREMVRQGRFAEAVEAALVTVSAEPLRESGQRVLIEGHLAEGTGWRPGAGSRPTAACSDESSESSRRRRSPPSCGRDRAGGPVTPVFTAR